MKPDELAAKIEGLAQQQQQDVRVAEGIKSTGSLRKEHQGMVESLRLRVVGRRGLADVFPSTAGSKDKAGAALLLSRQAQRLVASDGIWDDLFCSASITALRQEGVRRSRRARV